MNPEIKCSSELIVRIHQAAQLSNQCKMTYIEKGYTNQEHFARGQLDAFKAVLNWITELNENHD